MTLKIAINGTNKRLITPLRTFINGSRVRLSKGFTFINGEKVQLWGNTRTEFFSMPYGLGWDNNNLYIDDNNLYTHGDALVQVLVTPSSGGTTSRMPVTPSSGGGSYYVSIQQSNCLTTFTITNPTSATKDGYSQWGGNVMFSPDESDENNYIYYMTKDGVRNKVKIAKGSGASVIDTYTIPVSDSIWSVPLENGNNMWMRKYTSNYITYYYLGYNSTTIGSSNGNAAGNPSFDNGNFVIGHTGAGLWLNSMSGTSALTNDTYISTKLVDGNTVLVAGSNTNNAAKTKIARYNITNDSTIWEVVFSDDRLVDIIGEGAGKYYVIDKPRSYDVANQDVYLRIYEKNSGTELESRVLSYETNTGSRIIGWKTFPVKTKNGILAMRYLSGGRLYICKVFVD